MGYESESGAMEPWTDARRRLGPVVTGLLEAPDIRSFADRAAAYLERQGLARVAIVWHLRDGEPETSGSELPGDAALAAEARRDGSSVDEARRRCAARIFDEADGIGIGFVVDTDPAQAGLAVLRQAFEEDGGVAWMILPKAA